ncbi:unnamed protein product [Boreogadus saida]
MHDPPGQTLVAWLSAGTVPAWQTGPNEAPRRPEPVATCYSNQVIEPRKHSAFGCGSWLICLHAPFVLCSSSGRQQNRLFFH